MFLGWPHLFYNVFSTYIGEVRILINWRIELFGEPNKSIHLNKANFKLNYGDQGNLASLIDRRPKASSNCLTVQTLTLTKNGNQDALSFSQ